MSFLDKIKAFLTREGAEAKDMLDGASSRLDGALDAKERQAAESPVEKMERLQSEALESDPFDEVKARIDRAGAKADASAEVTELDAEARGDQPDQDRLDP